MKLELRDLINNYTPIEVEFYKKKDEVDDNECCYTYVAKKVFVDKWTNNKIIFSFHSINDKETIPKDFVSSICNCIYDTPYDYLINILNTHTNITVEWLQLEGTTSDYNILYDDAESEIDECISYKYKERRNGCWSKINFT